MWFIASFFEPKKMRVDDGTVTKDSAVVSVKLASAGNCYPTYISYNANCNEEW